MRLKRILNDTWTKVGAIVLIGGLASAAAVTSASADTSAQSHGVHVTAVSTHSVQLSWRGVGPVVENEAIVYDPSTLQLVKHTTFEADDSAGRAVDFGSGYEGRALAVKVDFKIDGQTTGWSQPVTFYTAVSGGTAGAQGPKGDTGPAGPAGPSGVVGLTTKALVTTDTTIATGGSFTSQEQLAGSIDLKAGTYLLTLNAKVAWKSGTGVYPQFFVYDGTPAADFSNNVMDVGSGALADSNATIDSYYSGTAQITVASDGTYNVYGFGYDANRGAGSYTLEGLTITATQLQVASS